MASQDNQFIDKKYFKKIKEPFRVIGIDLGTTNSAVAQIIYDPESIGEINAKCLEIRQETELGPDTDKIVPSVVAIYKNKTYVGKGAKRLINKIGKDNLVRNKNIFYEVKNEIGTKKYYPLAPDGYNTPMEISGKILEFIYNKAKMQNDIPIKKVTVTVPASYGISQRHDTLLAAGYAGLFDMGSKDLLDEPLSAFIYYLFKENRNFNVDKGKNYNFLVFDFGGGTCDVSIIEIGTDKTGSLSAFYKSVSRYHRLGGGDIDKAIVHELLIPELLRQNNLQETDLDFELKSRILEPCLLALAENLKIGISKLIYDEKEFNKYDESNEDEISKELNYTEKIKIKDKEIKLTNARITATQFHNILDDFMDEDFLMPTQTEYRMTNSIFAPVNDALDNCGLVKNDIDFVLMTGGSSYIPKVKEKMSEYFKDAEILTFKNLETFQTSIAIGAAYNSLYKLLNGSNFIRQVNHRGISVKTSKGYKEVIPSGVELPYPSDGNKKVNEDLIVPKINQYPGNLVLEFVDSQNKNLIYGRFEVEIPASVKKSDKIRFEFSMTENSALDINVISIGHEKINIKSKFDNPTLTNFDPGDARWQAEELENELNRNKDNMDIDSLLEEYENLAKLYEKLNYIEKAIHVYKFIIRKNSSPPFSILNKIGILYGDTGDIENAYKYFSKGFEIYNWDGFMFNLAYYLDKKNRYNEAIEVLDKGILSSDSDSKGPMLTLKAKVLKKLNKEVEADGQLNEAMINFLNPEQLNDFELTWYITCCRMKGDTEMLKQAEDIQSERLKHKTRTPNNNNQDLYPDIINND